MSNGPQVLPLSRSTPNSARSAWAPFRHRVYKRLWIATVVSNIGAWMYSAAASWLMTSLDPHPVMVALVQAVTSLPMFLFAIPAGALADIIEKRRFILTLEIGVAAVAALFALYSLSGWLELERCWLSCSWSAHSLLLKRRPGRLSYLNWCRAKTSLLPSQRIAWVST